MIKYLGNCNIDWNSVIASIEHQQPTYIGPSHKAGDPIPGLNEVTDLWTKANYKTVDQGGTVAWDMFLPGTNFDYDIVSQFAEYVGVKEYNSAWISRIWPGRFAPVHWDVNDDEATLPDCVRYHCHIGPPAFGHIFIADNTCLYNQEQGSVYQWSSRKLWHAGTNCGLVPKYIFNFW
jgi:hypothetical protein